MIALLFFGLCLVYCLSWFALGVNGRLCSVIVALPRHLLYYDLYNDFSG